MVLAIFWSVSGLAVIVFQHPAMVLDFDGISEMREWSTCRRHGDTAVKSEMLTEDFVLCRGVYDPKPSSLCKAGIGSFEVGYHAT